MLERDVSLGSPPRCPCKPMSHPKVCSPYDALIVCPGRADAMRRGDFTYDPSLGGYVWVALGDAIEKYEAWLSCPYCGERLPTGDMIETSFLPTDDED